MARQIPIVAALLITQGVLECLMGLYLAVMGPTMAAMFLALPSSGSSSSPPPPPEAAGVLAGMGIVFGAMGVAIIASAVLKFVAAARAFKYRGRVLGIVALASGVVSAMTCYCLPTALALGIYGLIVYLNDEAVRAFALGEQGLTPEQVLETLERGGSPAAPGPWEGSHFR